ncbi:MAG: histidinol-phosphate transaminase [Leptolyngbyaceae cyanobacterium MO_188.B28]|nr:histidinol-phosphate transaminase [Leptolyngbyaceae cyanobacterium MO_188.B28]
MLPFLRPDLAQLTAYTPHPGGSDDSDANVTSPQTIDPLDTNESPFDLPIALKEKLADSYLSNLASNRYPDGEHLRLKQAIADYVNESAKLPVDALTTANISIGNGSDELIRSLLIATCVGGAGSILTANPTFSMYAILARTLGVPVVSVNRSEQTFEVDLAAAQMAIEQTHQPPIRIVFMVHPNSPTGNALTEAELTWLRGLPEDILVVVDEAYFEFSQRTTVEEVRQHPNWVVLHTFSKAFRLAAHRVGYAIAHPTLIGTLEKTRLPYNLPSFSQTAALLALRHRQELLETIPLLLKERSTLLHALREEPTLQVWPSKANFIYLRLSQKALDGTAPQAQERGLNQLFQTLKSKGTLIRQTGGGLRITIGTPEENQRTLTHLKQAIKTLHPL